MLQEKRFDASNNFDKEQNKIDLIFHRVFLFPKIILSIKFDSSLIK